MDENVPQPLQPSPVRRFIVAILHTVIAGAMFYCSYMGAKSNGFALYVAVAVWMTVLAAVAWQKFLTQLSA